MASELRIHAIAFDDDGISFQFIRLPDDVRVDGRVVMSSQAQASLGHPDYAEDAELLMGHAQRMLKNILEDWQSSEPYMPPSDDDDDDDDDEQGMGFG